MSFAIFDVTKDRYVENFKHICKSFSIPFNELSNLMLTKKIKSIIAGGCVLLAMTEFAQIEDYNGDMDFYVEFDFNSFPRTIRQFDSNFKSWGYDIIDYEPPEVCSLCKCDNAMFFKVTCCGNYICTTCSKYVVLIQLQEYWKQNDHLNFDTVYKHIMQNTKCPLCHNICYNLLFDFAAESSKTRHWKTVQNSFKAIHEALLFTSYIDNTDFQTLHQRIQSYYNSYVKENEEYINTTQYSACQMPSPSEKNLLPFTRNKTQIKLPPCGYNTDYHKISKIRYFREYQKGDKKVQLIFVKNMFKKLCRFDFSFCQAFIIFSLKTWTVFPCLESKEIKNNGYSYFESSALLNQGGIRFHAPLPEYTMDKIGWITWNGLLDKKQKDRCEKYISRGFKIISNDPQQILDRMKDDGVCLPLCPDLIEEITDYLSPPKFDTHCPLKSDKKRCNALLTNEHNFYCAEKQSYVQSFCSKWHRYFENFDPNNINDHDQQEEFHWVDELFEDEDNEEDVQ